VKILICTTSIYVRNTLSIINLDYKKFNAARRSFRVIQNERNLYKNDTERNYNRLNMLIKDKLFDIYEYMGFPIREKKSEVFMMMKKLRRTRRKKGHDNRYVAKKINLKKALYNHIKKMLMKHEDQNGA
jgi:hypothetical protein